MMQFFFKKLLLVQWFIALELQYQPAIININKPRIFRGLLI